MNSYLPLQKSPPFENPGSAPDVASLAQSISRSSLLRADVLLEPLTCSHQEEIFNFNFNFITKDCFMLTRLFILQVCQRSGILWHQSKCKEPRWRHVFKLLSAHSHRDSRSAGLLVCVTKVKYCFFIILVNQ